MKEIQFSQPRRRIYKNILETIGGTPLVELHGVKEISSIDTTTSILAKLEYFNPMGSVKDRVGFNIINQAIKDGRLKPGMEIIEATSGNTGIGLCQAAALFKYPLTIVMPSSMSQERQKIMKAFGATLVLSDGSKGMPGAVEKYNELINENPEKYFPANQFGNPDNTKIHELTTANEIWEDTEGKVDIIVSAVGTAGTLIGITNELKRRNPNVKAVCVEPEESAILQGKPKGPHGIQGIGPGFVTDLYKKEIVDEIISIKTEDAWKMARCVCRFDGIMCGMSSGASILAALRVAKRPENKGKKIVVICASCGERYLSTDLYATVDEGSREEILNSLI